MWLGFLFGFNARLGRLHYFLSTLALAVGMTAAIFAIVTYAVTNAPRGTHPSMDSMAWPMMVCIVIFTGIAFTLQSMRVRDIGWDPVCVMPAWIALLIVDKLVASKVPAWSIGHEHHGTIVGGLVNLALILALTFWPSGDHEQPTPAFGEGRLSPPQPPRSQGPASVPAARIGRAAGGFGRRAF
jgi:uncharacterized membrane protein YhaH (DUF805 family)